MAKRKVEVPKRHKPQASFDPAYCEIVTDLALLGLADEEIAFTLRLPMSTFSKWKNDHPMLLEALKAGRADADRKVARQLYNSARGFYRTVTEPIKVKHADKSETIEIVTYEKYFPPNMTAQIFWLKNRQRALWNDRVNVEHTGENGKPIEHKMIPIEQLEPEQREQLRQLLLSTKINKTGATDVIEQAPITLEPDPDLELGDDEE